MATTGSAPDLAHADVELRMPADSAYISVLRTTAAGLAARQDFTLDDIEDLRMAVGEASAVVLAEADPGADLLCGFFLRPGELTVSVGVPSAHPRPPAEDTFAWQVLVTLADQATVTIDAGRFAIVLAMRSALRADD